MDKAVVTLTQEPVDVTKISGGGISLGLNITDGSNTITGDSNILFKDKTPSNWEITPIGDSISAYNSKSNERFYGTIKQFSSKLRE